MATTNVSFSPVAAVPNTEPDIAPELRKDGEGKPAPVYKIRLLRGRHVDRQGKFNAGDTGPHNAFPSGRFQTRVFQAKPKENVLPEFESTVDLASLVYNPKGYTPKFERVGGPPETVVERNPMDRREGETVAVYIERITALSAALAKTAKETQSGELASIDKMTEAQLVEYAENNELDYSSVKPGDLNALRNTIKAHVRGK